MAPRAVLVGLPGAGKSTTGRRLAKILSVAFADSDDLVESAQGRTVQTIFAESGEPAFREAERVVVSNALSEFDGILALGGGALTSPETRQVVTASGVPVVLLRAEGPTLRLRVGDATSRPLLTNDPDGTLARLSAERSPVFAEVSTFAVDTDHRSPGQVAATVAARLHDLGRRRA